MSEVKPQKKVRGRTEAEKKELEREVHAPNDTSKRRLNDTKGLKAVMLRNRFLYIMYRYSMLIFFFSLLMAIFSVGVATYFIRQPVSPEYIPLYEDGRPIILPKLSDPFKSDAEIQNFALRAIKKVNMYDYVNSVDQFSEMSEYFSQETWNNYLEKLSVSGTLSRVRANHWVSSALATSMPIVVDKRDVNGVFTWGVEIPSVTITYSGVNSLSTTNKIYLIISRVSIIDNPNGIAITKYVVQEIK